MTTTLRAALAVLFAFLAFGCTPTHPDVSVYLHATDVSQSCELWAQRGSLPFLATVVGASGYQAVAELTSMDDGHTIQAFDLGVFDGPIVHDSIPYPLGAQDRVNGIPTVRHGFRLVVHVDGNVYTSGTCAVVF